MPAEKPIASVENTNGTISISSELASVEIASLDDETVSSALALTGKHKKAAIEDAASKH